MIQSRTFGAQASRFLIILVLVLIACLSLAPIINTIMVSVSSSTAVNAGKVYFLPVDINFSSYVKILDDEKFWRAFLVSVERVALGGAINMVLTILMAYPLSRTASQFRARNVYMWIIVFTMLFSGGIVPWYMVISKLGLINSIWALVLPGAVPVFNVILLMNFFKGIPKEMEEAAFIDGAGPLKILWHIFIPVSLPSLATITLFVIVGHWNNFFDGIVLINDSHKIPLQTYLQQLNLTRDQMQNLSVEQLQQYNKISNTTLNSAKILVSMIPILLIYPFLQRYLIHGIVLGSVKE
ncbi:carbohydrate ABC transporter permease [Paenibacillus cellulositrophicus]|uniref:Aldouronate transport system permease protein n=1 Tax=Paenibacillus favisporus TaxID=221028 RepID=A0ABV2FA59_9BACL|nr:MULTISPECIES: carbohydrate ABC transporter permease [Paenibacillus]OXL85562.1 ABC transporter permease [Paenibacillus sp. SSG-1]RED32502.1 putative aldouronate transport system permease protein [Paenibacillus sp. VMFN-D1]UYO06728.1 carbohydrate ABC transporter permease [Paenibacillus sp. PSB04]